MVALAIGMCIVCTILIIKIAKSEPSVPITKYPATGHPDHFLW